MFQARAIGLFFGLLGSAASTVICPATNAPRQEAQQAPKFNFPACNSLTPRKEWRTFTPAEKAAYIEAESCLQNYPPVGVDPNGVPENIWDEIQYVHYINSDYIHANGQFLPWHRAYERIHVVLQQQLCGYNGPTPWWHETLDIGNMAASPVFTPDAFGGDGIERFRLPRCLRDGPFEDVVLHLDPEGGWTSNCIQREFDDRWLYGASQEQIDSCNRFERYSSAFMCIYNGPHIAGHSAIGGTMGGVSLSPGDPAFHLHHGFIDKIWWDWQNINPQVRFWDMSGPNTARNSEAGPEFTDHSGDPGTETTLGHVLWFADLFPNVTVADVMDLRGPLICSDYV